MASPAMDAAKPKITSSSVAATISESPKPIWQNIQYNDLSQPLEIVNLGSIEVYGQMENDGGTVVIDT